nr:MAG TPA: hypothetical protein [Bacteriophage sp.]
MKELIFQVIIPEDLDQTDYSSQPGLVVFLIITRITKLV